MEYYLLIGLILTVVLISGCTQSQPRFAAISGWLFEVQTDQGTERFLVAFEEHSLPSAPETFLRVLNEQQLIELTRSGNWTGPFEKHTQQEWSQNCLDSRGCDYSEYENLMLSYMQENNIDGEIVNKYVGYFMIAGSGLNFQNK